MFGMLGSQQAIAGLPPSGIGNIVVDKAVFEGSSASVVEGESVNFEITVRFDGQEASVSSIMMNDLLPSGLTYSSHSSSGAALSSDYNPNTGDWTIDILPAIGGSSSFLSIQATVDEGTCGQTITNTATLEGWTNGPGTTNGNTNINDDSDSVDIFVIPPEEEDCPEPPTPQNFLLIGHDVNFNKHILIDINTGAATDLGPSTFTSTTSGLAATRDPVDTATSPDDDTVITRPGGTIFGVYRDATDGKDYVIWVDTITGKANKIVEVVGGILTRGVGFGPTGTFFAAEGTTQTLYTIDMITGVKTAVGTGVGNIGFTVDNLQFDTGSSPARFLSLSTGSPADSIISIDPTTGVGTSIGTLKDSSGSDISIDGCALVKNPQDGSWFTVARSSSPIHLFEVDIATGTVTDIGDLNQNAQVASANICGLAFEEEFVAPPSEPGAGGDHEPAALGILRDGRYIGGGCDIGIDGQCFAVTKRYHHELELIEMLTSPHTISNEIYCNEGYQECNHITVAFLEMDEFFPNTVMSVSADKSIDGTWSISWSDPQDFIKDPDDAVEPIDITFTSQIIDNKRIGTSFTIDFRDKDTGQLKIGFHVEDNENGFTNIYANEGVKFIDKYGYPYVETAYEKPLAVEKLCLNEDPDYRYSCAFADKRDRVTQNAEETLRQMMDNEYIYK